MEQAIEAGVFRAPDPLATADVIWAQFHGIVTLAIGMPGFYTPERARNAVEQAITMMINGLKP